MLKKPALYVAIALLAVAALFALRGLSSGPGTVPSPMAAGPEAPAASIGPGAACGYVWAYNDLPELTGRLQQVLPTEQVRAQAFGEDCVYADGHAVFSALETDFYVVGHIESLQNEEELGNRMAKALVAVLALPAEEAPGVRPGFVEFRFSGAGADSIVVRVPIEQFETAAMGMTGAKLFRLFHKDE
jgi:hypothetical protein